MNNQQQHNTFLGDDGLPIQIPPPAEAWDNMRKKLDDNMPETGVLLPNNIINVNTRFINGITMLCTLLFIGCLPVWLTGNTLFGGRENNGMPQTSVAAPAVGAVNAPNGNNANTNSNVTPPGGAIAGAAQNSGAVNTGNRLAAQPGRPKPTGKLVLTSNSLTVVKSAAQPATPQQNANVPAITGQDKTSAPVLKPVVHAGEDPATVKKNKENSLVKEDNTAEEVHVEDKSIHVMAGLQWHAQLPVSGAQHYFAGPNTSSQPYRLLIPGAWVGFQFEENLFVLEVNPFAATVYNPKPFITTSEVNGQTEITKVKSLNKLFGLTAAIRYSYNVKGNWWAGGGIQAGLVNKGVATVITETNNNGIKMYNTSFVRLETSDMAELAKFKVRTDAEVFYRSPKWQAGLRGGVYFTPATKNYSTQKNPLELELFYRWQLWNNDKKRH